MMTVRTHLRRAMRPLGAPATGYRHGRRAARSIDAFVSAMRLGGRERHELATFAASTRVLIDAPRPAARLERSRRGTWTSGAALLRQASEARRCLSCAIARVDNCRRARNAASAASTLRIDYDFCKVWHLRQECPVGNRHGPERIDRGGGPLRRRRGAMTAERLPRVRVLQRRSGGSVGKRPVRPLGRASLARAETRGVHQRMRVHPPLGTPCDAHTRGHPHAAVDQERAIAPSSGRPRSDATGRHGTASGAMQGTVTKQFGHDATGPPWTTVRAG